MGNTLLPGTDNKLTLRILLIVFIVFFHGCASKNAANLRPSDNKQIVDIIISENTDALFISIVGNQALTYTEVKQTDPSGVLLNFPATSLAVGNTYYQSPTNEIIRFLNADETTEDENWASRIFIALKKDRPYNIIPSNMQLQVVIPKRTVPAKEIHLADKSAGKVPVQKLTPASIAAATRLKSVIVRPRAENLTITVNTDGTIKNYQSFTIAKPPRIVFDLYNLKSPFAKEQKIAVETKWVRQIRYFGHPEKLRLVLDTWNEYLSKFSSAHTNAGLLIQVGKIPENPRKK